MKKVLFICVSLDLGGTENYILRFYEAVKNKNIELVVLCKRGVGGSLEDKYLALGIRVEKLKIYNLPLRSFVLFYQFLKKEKFNTVCDFTGNFSGITLLASKLAGVNKRIIFYRKSTNLFKEDKLRLLYNKWLNRLALNNSTKILSNSHDAFNFFYSNQNTKTKKFKVIRNGIPIDKFNNRVNVSKLRHSLGISENTFVIGHVGRFHKDKNHKTIISVAESLF